MKTNILVSGFFEGFPEEFIKEVKDNSTKLDNFVFISADFSKLDERTLWKRQNIVNFFSEKGLNFKQVIFIDQTLSKEQAVEAIKNADLVWIGGGNTLLQMDNIIKYELIDPLLNRKGVTIGMSAGAINMAKLVVLAKDEADDIPNLSIYEGIGLSNINIEPHLNCCDESHFEEIKEASNHSQIVGLHDGDFLVETNEEVRYYGDVEFFRNLKTM